MTSILIKRQIEGQTRAGERICESTQEEAGHVTRMMYLSQRTPGISFKYQKLEVRPGNFLYSLQKAPALATPLVQTLAS